MKVFPEKSLKAKDINYTVQALSFDNNIGRNWSFR